MKFLHNTGDSAFRKAKNNGKSLMNDDVSELQTNFFLLEGKINEV